MLSPRVEENMVITHLANDKGTPEAMITQPGNAELRVSDVTWHALGVCYARDALQSHTVPVLHAYARATPPSCITAVDYTLKRHAP